MVSNDTDNRKDVNVNNEVSLTVEEVVSICKKVKIDNHTLIFDSFGSNEVRIKTQEFMDNNDLDIYDCEKIINSLNVSELVAGPIDNYVPYRINKLWIFKHKHLEKYLYIKLLIFNKRRCVAVISLHKW